MVKTCKVKDKACISISMFHSKECMLGLSLNFSQGYSHNALKKCLGEVFTFKFILMKIYHILTCPPNLHYLDHIM